MIRAVAFAAIVAGATWLSHLYDRYIRNTNERNTDDNLPDMR